MEIREIVFNVLVPCVIAIITTVITARVTLAKEIKKSIYDERKLLYENLLQEMTRLAADRSFMFCSDYIYELERLKTQLDCVASKGVLKIINPVVEEICLKNHKHYELFCSPEATSLQDSRKECGEVDDLQLQQEEELFIERNLIDSKTIEKVIMLLKEQIRKEIKTK